jgi:hypothetical protein
MLLVSQLAVYSDYDSQVCTCSAVVGEDGTCIGCC